MDTLKLESVWVKTFFFLWLFCIYHLSSYNEMSLLINRTNKASSSLDIITNDIFFILFYFYFRSREIKAICKLVNIWCKINVTPWKLLFYSVCRIFFIIFYMCRIRIWIRIRIYLCQSSLIFIFNTLLICIYVHFQNP